jgi:queuosine precursor transporter
MTQRVSLYFVAIAAVFITTLITANIVAIKPIPGLGPLGPVPAAMLVFPISYIFGDILTEVYGYARARQVIWLGFACNLYAVLTITLAGRLPGAAWWTPQLQASYGQILGATPRLLAASFVAYLVGEFANSYVLARVKVATGGRYLWLRTIASTLVGQGLDSVVFIGLAFGLQWPIIVSQWLLKCLYEAAATPVTYAIVGRLKRAEGLDVYDRDTNFNPFHLSDAAEAS